MSIIGTDPLTGSQTDEKADAADGHLLGEMTSEVNLAELLDIATKEFTASRLREAFENWQASERKEKTIHQAIKAHRIFLADSTELLQRAAPSIILSEPTWRKHWLQRKFANSLSWQTAEKNK